MSKQNVGRVSFLGIEQRRQVKNTHPHVRHSPCPPLSTRAPFSAYLTPMSSSDASPQQLSPPPPRQPKPPPAGPAPPAPASAPPAPASAPPAPPNHTNSTPVSRLRPPGYPIHACSPDVNGNHTPSHNAKGKKRNDVPIDPATMYESLKNRIAALEEEEVLEEEEERRYGVYIS